MATIKVCGSEYSPEETAVIFAQVLNDVGEPANDASVTLSVFDADDSKILDGVTMEYLTGSNGLYKYSFIAPSNAIRMVADVKSINPVAYGVEDLYISLKAMQIGEIKKDTDNLPDDPTSKSNLEAVHGAGSWEGAMPPSVSKAHVKV